MNHVPQCVWGHIPKGDHQRASCSRRVQLKTRHFRNIILNIRLVVVIRIPFPFPRRMNGGCPPQSQNLSSGPQETKDQQLVGKNIPVPISYSFACAARRHENSSMKNMECCSTHLRAENSRQHGSTVCPSAMGIFPVSSHRPQTTLLHPSPAERK